MEDIKQIMEGQVNGFGDPKNSALIGLGRCPTCYKLPSIKFDDKGFDKVNFTFRCEEHGHEASGDDIQMAITNWNLYVKLYVKWVA